MKSDSELLNELAHRTHFLRELTTEESAQMKQALLDIYKDVANLCQKHNLTLMLCGGTCLGAVRHKGFIPWDDDLDLMMPRQDYEQLISLLEKGDLGDKYEYSAPNSQTDSKNVFLKIFRKNSVNEEVFCENSPFPKGLYVDVFALDTVPKNKITQLIKGLIANALQYCSILTMYAQYPSPSLKEFMSLQKRTKWRFRIKTFLGKIVSIIPHRKWVWWFDKYVKSSKDNGVWGIPTGRKYYNGEIFPKSVFTPAIEAEFEGIKVYIPNGYDLYLKNLYHNYMQLPPVEKRERHFIINFQLPTD
ncbi:MAG: LicD family protein [Paludibacteraceae bacterium]|nr:LicD family protein [Paludibacteraceae bacterium]